jgi:hypothetical protein
MNYLLLFLSIILSCTSVKHTKLIKQKFCFNCKYFISDYEDDKFAKCSLYPIIKEDNSYLVTGIDRQENVDYNYCTVARNFEKMCGENGNMHKRQYIKKTEKY